MAAGINDKFNKVLTGTTRPVATTLSAQKLVGATSATVQATTGWETSTAVHGIMYRVDASNVKVPGSQIDWKAVVSGTTLSNFTVTAGTDDTYEVGTVVELAPTAAWGDDMATGLAVEHNQDGTHSDITATTVTTTGRITAGSDIKVADTKSIVDGNSNELIKFSQTSSAVNEVTVKNAATGNAPELKATGGDTNVNLNLTPQGTGTVNIGGSPVLTQLGYNLDNGGSTLTTSYATQATVTATSNGKKVYVDFGSRLLNDASGATRTVDIRIQCDGVTVDDLTGISILNNQEIVPNFTFEHTPSSGSHTWTLQILAVVNTAVRRKEAFLRVVEAA